MLSGINYARAPTPVVRMLNTMISKAYFTQWFTYNFMDDDASKARRDKGS